MFTQVCTLCGTERDIVFFKPDTRSKTGYRKQCLICRPKKETKKCWICKKELPFSEFPKNRSTVSGYNSSCKECTNSLNRKNASTLEFKYSTYRYAANKRGYCFELTFTDFCQIIKHHCVYCGRIDNIGIDRVDNTIGYTTNNCVAACGKCNTMKMDSTVSEFKEHIKQIYQHLFAV